MSNKRRKLSDRVQTVIDEVLHALRTNGIDASGAPLARTVQLSRLEERVLMSASPIHVVAEAAGMSTDTMAAHPAENSTASSESADDATCSGSGEASAFNVENASGTYDHDETLAVDDAAFDDFLASSESSTNPIDGLLDQLQTCSTQLNDRSLLDDDFATHVSVGLEGTQAIESELTDSGIDLVPENAMDQIEQVLGRNSKSERSSLLSGPELIVIDSRVQDADTLLAELLNTDRDFRILRLDSEIDGVSQITEKLGQIGNVSAIHLLTHGAAGEILLGSTVLNASTLAQHAPEFVAWQHNLTENADLLLYGCDVAETTEGKDFVDALGQLTAADVAASSDITGNESLGGDWNLEYVAGSVEAVTPFPSQIAQEWNETLAITLADTNEFAVNTTTTNTQNTSAETRGSQQAVSLAADGSYVVVWSSLNQDGSGWGVYARRFDSTGTALTGEILVSQTTSGNQQWARVASKDDGSFVVTWTGGATGSEDVYFRRFAANGAAVGGEVLANNTTTGIQKNSVIALDRTTNQFVIAWQGEGPGDTSSIFFRRFNSTGTALDATDQLVNTAGAHSEQDPAIAMQTAGGFVIAYERGDSNKVYFQRFIASGAKAGSETQIDNALSTSFGISIASDAAGNFTVAYREESLLSGIWQRSFNADGTESHTWSRIVSGDAVSSSISMLSDGSYIVTWQKSSDGDGIGIYAQRFNSDSSSNGAAFLVNQTTAGGQSQPSVAMLDANNFVVVWSGQGTGDTDGVFARQFNLTIPSLDLDANDSSAATGRDFLATYTNGGGPVAIVDGDATLSDIDSTNLTSLTVTITDRQNGNNEILAATTAGTSITANYTNGILTLTGSDTVAHYQQVLRTVTFNNLQNPATGSSRTITFLASDGANSSLVATTSLTLNAALNHAPVITSNGGGATAAISVAENSTTVTTVTAADTDLPAQTLAYSISGGADASMFLINSSTGALTFTTAPNFELPNDAGLNNVYDVIVQVSDGSLMDTQTIAVTVTAVNDNTPTITSNGGGSTASISVVENSTSVTTVTATDVDLPGQTLTYSISGGADAAKFTINSSTGVLSFLVAPNFEAATDVGANNVYDVTVRVSDGSLDDTQAISVTVTNSTTGDVLLATQDTYVSDSQKSNNYGQSTSLIVDKSGGGIGNGRALLLFDLADLPANVTITSATLVMQATQNSGAFDVNVYQVTQAWSEGSGNGATGAASWNQRQAGVNWTAAGGDFASTIVATLNTAAIGQHSWDITSLVADWKAGNKANYGVILGSPNTGSGTVTYDSAEGATVPQLLVSYDISNAPPVITSNGGGVSGSVSVAENSIAVTTVTATDANAPGQMLTYSISGGADAARFVINSSTGVLTFSAAPNFESPNDVGANNIYDVTVQVSDGITTDTQAIAVTVTNVNEAPVMTAGSVSLGTIAANQTSTPMTVSSFAGASISDPDAGALAGIAVTASSGTGTWQYSTNGVTWINVGAVSSTQALLLRSTDSVRFVGNAISAGTASLMYAAWDQTGTTSGQQGTKVSLSTLGTGGSTPFSSTTNTANLSLLAVNQAPVATSDTYSLNEGSTLATTTAAGWFSPDWNARQRISFNNAAGAALTDHVVLVTLNTSNFDYANAQAAGQDLRFVDGDGTLLDYEIEQWNPGGTSQIWVRVPQINALSNTDFIWLYSGNSQAAAAQNSGAVWVNQAAVLHMNGIPTDSSANAISVTTSGTTSISGIVTAARDFDGVDDSIQLGSSAEVNNLFASGGTVSAWINPDGWGEAGYGRIADKAATVLANAGGEAGWGLQVTSDGAILFDHGFSSTQGEWRTNNGVISLSGGWYQVTVVYNASTPTIDPRIYINGVQVAVSETLTPSGTILDDSALQFTVGNHAAATTRTFDGAIDELRAAKTSLTAAQVLADYRAVAGTLATIGASEAGPGGVLHNDTDPEGSPLSVSLVSGPAQAASFTLNADGSFQYTHNGSETTADSFTYSVSDGNSTSTATVNLTIRAVNDSNPVIISNGGGASASINVAENSTAVTTVTATDADLPAPTLTYSISGGADAALFSINATTGALAFTSGRNFEAPSDAGGNNIYDVVVQATDGSRNDSQSIAVAVMNANDIAPVVTAGQTLTVSENAKNNDVIGAIVATDADGTTTFSNWTIVSGNTNGVFQIHASSGQLTVNNKNELDAAVRPSYALMVRVSDGINTSSVVAVTVNVTPFNEIPVAHAGSDITISEGGSIALDGSGSSDLDGDTITYSWDIDNDGLFGELGEPTTVNSTLTWATLNSFGIVDNGTYTIGLHVSDGNGGTDTDTLTLRVNNVSPTITSANTIIVNENLTSVMLVASTDPTDTVTYSITGGADQGRFTINSVTGALSFVAPPNFEAPTDSNTNNIYAVQVTANDGDGGSANQTILVTVANVNEAPSLTVVQPVLSLAENASTLTATAIATLTIVDDGTGTNTLSLAGADAGSFEIVGTSLRLKAGTSLNFEVKTNYSVQIILNDTVLIGGPFATQNITLNITNFDESPTADAGGPYTIAEGGSLTVTASLSTDPEGLPTTYRWDIDNDGSFDDATGSTAILTWAQLKTLSIPVNDSGVRTVRVRVTDAGGNSAVDSAVLTIADTSPTINVTGAATAISGTPYTINIATSDPGNDAISSFRITWGDGASQIVSGTTTSVQHVYSTPGVTRSISVTATDENGTHAMTGGPLLVTVGNTVPSAITLDNVRVPGFTARAVVGNVTFNDPDIGDAHSIAVSDTRFEIISGQLKLRAGVWLNPNNEINVPVTITVTDLSGASADATFVLEVNRTPVATTIPNVTAAEDFGTLTVSTASAFTDPDGDVLAYSLAIVSQDPELLASLTINSATGQVTTTSTANRHGSAAIDVTATDRSGASATTRMNIIVQPVNDAPVAQNYTASTIAGQALNKSDLLATAYDLESNPVTALLISSTSNGALTLNANGSFTYTPNQGFFGTDSFVYVVSDGNLPSTQQTATITVQPPIINVGSTTSGGGSSSVIAPADSSTSGSSGASTTSGSNSGSQDGTSGTSNGGGKSGSSGSNVSGNPTNAGSDPASSGTTVSANVSEEEDDEAIRAALSQQLQSSNAGAGSRIILPGGNNNDAAQSDQDIARRNKSFSGSFLLQHPILVSGDNGSPIEAQLMQKEVLYRSLIQQNTTAVEELGASEGRRISLGDQVVGSVEVVTTVSSVGYLIWNAVRGGMLLSSLLSQIPAWNMLDPLLVIDGESKEEDKESLQNIMDQQQKKLKREDAGRDFVPSK